MNRCQPYKIALSIILALLSIVLGSFSAHASLGAIGLNRQSGATTFTRTDLIIGKQFPIAITRSYIGKSGYAGPLGHGWALTIDKQLFTYPDNSAVIRTGNGVRRKFTKSGTTFTSPTGDTGTLTYDSVYDSYTYTSPDNTREFYDSYGRLVSITAPRGDILAFTYASTTKSPRMGLLSSNLDQSTATVISYGYQLTKIEEKNSTGTLTGKWVSFAYNSTTGLLDSISDSLGRTVTYGHSDGIGNLTSVSGPGITASYVYGDSNNKHFITSADEGYGSYAITYDSQGRVNRQSYGRTTIDAAYTTSGTPPVNVTTVTTTNKDAQGNVIGTEIRTLTFDSNKHLTKETDSLGNQIVYTRNSLARVTRKEWWQNTGTVATPILVLNHAVDYTYDDNGNMLSETKMDGTTPATSTFAYTTTATYDSRRNLLTITDPLSRTTTYTYTAKNQILTVSSYLGAITNTYDTSDRLSTVTDAAGVTTTYTYDNRNNVTGISDGAGTTTYSYDSNDRLTSITDATGVSVTVNFNASGALTGITDVAGKTTSATYDALNRLRTVTDPLWNRTAYTYNSSGDRDSITDANNHTTNYAYTDKGRVATITDALNNSTSLTYGATGCPSCGGSGGSNLVAFTDARNQTTTFQYDFLNRITSASDPLSKNTSYYYDKKGNLDHKIDANGATTSYSYDAVGRTTAILYPDNSSVTYAYDDTLRTRIVTGKNSSGATVIAYTYQYDTGWRLTTVTDSRGYTVDYEYDTTGRRSKTTLQKNTADQRIITYGYDAAGRAQTINSSSRLFTYNYDSKGRRSNLSYPNQTSASYSYDDANRLTGISHNITGGTLAFTSYPSLDGIGNRLAKSTGPIENYTYDATDRLTAVTGARSETYSFDNVGNRTTGPGSIDTGYQHDAANRMTKGRQYTYSYDNNGNQSARTIPAASDKNTVLTWDYANRLTKLERAKGLEKKTVTFSYDPFGRRIEKKLTTVIDNVTRTTTTDYVYDGNNIAIEIYTDENNVTTKTYLTHGTNVDEHLAMERVGQFYFFHQDGLGSVTTITDVSTSIIQSYTYDSYGLPTPTTSFRNAFQFAGRPWDKEVALYFNEARYYDPMEGRFLNKDLIGFRGGVNIFAYVLNNPIKYIDPTGLLCTYSQSTGQMACTDDATARKYYNERCYAGTGNGRNNPNAQDQANVGPLPRGDWEVKGNWYNSPNTGRNTIRLEPLEGNTCFNTDRDCDSFRMHGDNRDNDASEGCIVCPPNRTRIPSGETIRVTK